MVFGGIIVKQVSIFQFRFFAQLSQTYQTVSMRLSTFQGVITAISSIVFLGTPHITKKNIKGMQQLLLTMRSDLVSESKMLLEQEDLTSIVDVCLRFDEMRPTIPILSCYETQQAKLHAPFWRRRRVVV